MKGVSIIDVGNQHEVLFSAVPAANVFWRDNYGDKILVAGALVGNTVVVFKGVIPAGETGAVTAFLAAADEAKIYDVFTVEGEDPERLGVAKAVIALIA